MDIRRAELEVAYRAELIAALKVAAGGKWGLFDHKADRTAQAAVKPVIDSLAEIGEEIDELREQLGLEAYALQQRFLAARGPVGADAVGEPKQAKAWLDALAREEAEGQA